MKQVLPVIAAFLFTAALQAQNVGIGTSQPVNQLQVGGSFLVTKPVTATETPPTPAQMKTMVNASTISFFTTDSTGRIYDPGGPSGNYIANLTANAQIFSSAGVLAIEVTAESIQLGTGDSLFIRENSFTSANLLAVGNGYNTTGKWVFSRAELYIVFKSNGDASVGSGFSLLFRKLFDNSASLPDVSGMAGYSMFFDVKTGAFRSGTINNSAALGEYSTAMGANPIANAIGATAFGTTVRATGQHSVAMGESANASGNASLATGSGTTASGSTSTAMGVNTTASAFGAIAMGGNTTAAGFYALATGNLTMAGGDYATATGKYTDATGYASTAMGDSTLASGRISFASGFRTMANGHYATALGYGTTAGQLYSTAMGFNTIASGVASTAMGDSAKAIGARSMSVGTRTTTNGDHSVAMGYETFAGDFASIALGRQTTASGTASVALGDGTTASGTRSTAMGNLTNANGSYSTAMGVHTIARGYAGTVLGLFNTPILAGTQVGVNSTTPLFIIGNGDDDANRNNAFVVLKSGNIGIGTNAPTARLDVDANFKLGANGTVLTEVIKSTETYDIPSLAPGASDIQTFAVTNAQLGAVVSISPLLALPDGITISYARVSAAGTVEVKVVNAGNATQNPASMSFILALIR
ncbi:MAG: hypothetical protein JNM68_16295 [Dinghuibacter sp.]|nr:hypothetical protein [Dinghuibacter sp.]